MRAAAASIVGRAHRRLSRPSQDAALACASGPLVAVAVADGCSQGAHSEIGAGLAARFGVAEALRRAAAGTPLAELPCAVASAWSAEVHRLAFQLCPKPSDLPWVIQESMLSTLWVALAVSDQVVVFGVGDGVVVVDGVVQCIDQGPAPDYPAYALLPSLPQPRLQVLHRGRATSVLIATDGAAGREKQLAALCEARLLRKNPSLLQKRLNLVRDAENAPEDDCSVAVLFASSEEAACASS
jgi:hypothetical protein